MKRQCEGYCGGMVGIRDVRTVRGGERFCPECYGEYKRREYYEAD
jgi:hypothetical protein